MSRFYDKLKMNQEARRNPEKPYFFVAPDILRKKVTSYQHQQRESRKPSKSTLSDYDRTLTKSIEAAQKKKRAGKGIAQLGQQAHQSIPPLVVGNEYGSNLGLMHQANIRLQGHPARRQQRLQGHTKMNKREQKRALRRSREGKFGGSIAPQPIATRASSRRPPPHFRPPLVENRPLILG